jgi:hypothetical protein
MKHPITQFSDEEAHQMVEDFIIGKQRELVSGILEKNPVHFNR